MNLLWLFQKKLACDYLGGKLNSTSYNTYDWREEIGNDIFSDEDNDDDHEKLNMKQYLPNQMTTLGNGIIKIIFVKQVRDYKSKYKPKLYGSDFDDDVVYE